MQEIKEKDFAGMLFNSIEFLIFFPVVFIGFYILPHKFRWGLLLAASWVFYASFKLEYFYLIISTTLTGYIAAILIEKATTRSLKKLYLILNLTITLGTLIYFKYFNFFIESINYALSGIGEGRSFDAIHVILPIGISFYTFQVIGYTLDVYWKKNKAERHPGIFALYVSFFPQLVAGPIERAERLIPQLRAKVTFDYQQVKQGFILILWGYLQKVAIADRIAILVDPVFETPSQYNSLQLLITMVIFAIQVYCDFAGYTNIALGTAKTLGVNLIDNFNRPFAATNISDFWRRWHISLSSWGKDYIFMPISFSKRKWGQLASIYAVFATFIFLGLWHGAEQRFFYFGLFMGIVFYFELLSQGIRKKIAQKTPTLLYNGLSITITFTITVFLFLFFRITSIEAVGEFAGYMIQNTGASWKRLVFTNLDIIVLVSLIIFTEIIQYLSRKTRVEQWVSRKPLLIRWGLYVVFLFLILMFGAYDQQQFIYFQF